MSEGEFACEEIQRLMFASERLEVNFMGWILKDHGDRKVSPDDAVAEFVKYCFEENQKAMHVARGGDGKSFMERCKEFKGLT